MGPWTGPSTPDCLPSAPHPLKTEGEKVLLRMGSFSTSYSPASEASPCLGERGTRKTPLQRGGCPRDQGWRDLPVQMEVCPCKMAALNIINRDLVTRNLVCTTWFPLYMKSILYDDCCFFFKKNNIRSHVCYVFWKLINRWIPAKSTK